MPRLLVGLGNPGAKYRAHRHNVGFMVLDRVHARALGSEWREKYSGEVSRGILAATECLLLKPQTFMNLSGRAVQKALQDLRLTPADIVVVHDDLDLEFADVRVKVGGGHGGHNGLRDINATIGPDYVRVRVGIGRPSDATMPVEGYVLSAFDKSEQAEIDDVLARAAQAVERLVSEGPDKTMNVVNAKPKRAKGPA